MNGLNGLLIYLIGYLFTTIGAFMVVLAVENMTGGSDYSHFNGLVKRSPDETAFFLRQTAAIPNSPDTPWIIRQLLRQFPPDLEESLREFSRELVKQHP